MSEVQRVPFFRSDVGVEEIEIVTQVLRSGWLTTGPVVAQLEADFCEATGAPYAVAVNSCTSGLHATLIACGIGPGDQVITSPYTFCGSIQAIEEAGAEPVFIDIGNDLNLDADLLSQHLTPSTKAILPVHIAGLSCDMLSIHTFADQHGLAVIEDAAHAFGATLDPSLSNAAVYSFYANKNLTTGEGGMVTTSDAAFADRLRCLVNHGVRRLQPGPLGAWQYDVKERGLKGNMSDVLAAIGVAQLRKRRESQQSRQRIAETYGRAFTGSPYLQLPPTHAGRTHAWHLYIVQLELERLTADRDQIATELMAGGVGCSVHFRPIPLHSYFHRYGSLSQWPNVEHLYPRVLSLPIFPAMTDDEQQFVIKRVLEVLKAHSAC